MKKGWYVGVQKCLFVELCCLNNSGNKSPHFSCVSVASLPFLVSYTLHVKSMHLCKLNGTFIKKKSEVIKNKR